jgi:putative ABC transport system permease protein
MHLLRTLISGLRALLRRDRSEREMSEELEAYLDAAVNEKMRAGMGREEAVRASRVEMGSMEAVKEQMRSSGWESHLGALWHDLRYGLRMLARNPGFTAIAVVTLALGIGANTAIFSLIDAVMLRMLPVSSPQQLMLLQIYDPHAGGEADPTFTNPIWEEVRDQQNVFSGVFAWGHEQFDLSRGGAVHNAAGIFVSGNFFNTLGLRPAAGRLITMSDDRRGCPAVAVLSYGFWQGHYGGANGAIGQILSLGDHPFEVIGVAPPGFDGMEVGTKFDVAVPICSAAIFDGKETRLDARSWWWLRVVGRIKPGIGRTQLTARLNVLSPGVFNAVVPQKWSPNMQREFARQVLTAVPAATGTSFLRRQFEQPLSILMAVVGLVLLIACANIASLMLARAAARHKEIAVRQALGASRARLIRQLLTESVLVSLAGALLGVLFASWGTALLVRYISTTQNAVFLDLSLDGRRCYPHRYFVWPCTGASVHPRGTDDGDEGKSGAGNGGLPALPSPKVACVLAGGAFACVARGRRIVAAQLREARHAESRLRPQRCTPGGHRPRSSETGSRLSTGRLRRDRAPAGGTSGRGLGGPLLRDSDQRWRLEPVDSH